MTERCVLAVVAALVLGYALGLSGIELSGAVLFIIMLALLGTLLWYCAPDRGEVVDDE
jgi:hypothetical protein